ncbi:glycoside hydrolase family 2 [Sphingomonas sp. A2-49]|uniref:glycosyl hydrolase 2 galactose-binding domain-containing protein n=1 Tax=Sphingomonas sp. A2-49 TaxID=1391375 RepID=UPI0021D374CE|nr:LamG-like jellyroll fold domain-containing protein [Sphingomonas sp. A2-49]MCU6453691.1 glycoside hydrolase family 2 [Sphingomonas sp. A2-49]
MRATGKTAVSIWTMATALIAAGAAAQTLGPINADLPAGGEAVRQAIGGDGAAPVAAADWTLSAWVEARSSAPGLVRIAGFGSDGDGPRRMLAFQDGRPAIATEAGTVAGGDRIAPGGWHLIAATSRGGIVRLFVDGRPVAGRALASAAVAPVATLAPRIADAPVFAGRVAGLRLESDAASPAALRERARERPDPALIAFTQGSPRWPVQVRQMYGQVAPQDAWTLPRSRAPIPAPVARPLPVVRGPVRQPDGSWAIDGWRLAEAPKVAAAGATISRAGFDARRWYAATVPGTVLTTLVDRGVYPDPAYGLNNTVIPEGLARQDYWYRTEFDVPAEAAGKRQTLVFDGVNYAAQIWVNGVPVGTMQGAFVRGRFAVTLAPGRNAIAVRVSPPPHRGLAHEESMTAGVGENGGMQMLDGPTFVATEGWDWIPSIRDRNTGLWQGVRLIATDAVDLGDTHVVTSLPRADNSIANVEITTPVTNRSAQAVTATVRAAFDDVAVERQVRLAPGASADVVMSPADFPALAVRNPKLWWPNGYGDPALHALTVTASVDGATSDVKTTRFGMRQVTYDLSLMDRAGVLERVGIDLTRARALGQRIVDGSHDGIRKVPNGWAASLVPGAETSPAVTRVSDAPGLSPHLVIRVNGVKIAARGGNIGMDDFMKRVDRARLEPMFRLHRDAHLNIVRNWVGQDTGDTFFDLADEYGLMVLSDFWESTQDYNIEAQDVALFMTNATDVVKRYRNHPSIVVWFGRNEGVPQPLLNERLEDLIATEDGTRLYMGSSNRVNLQNSGPYNWRPPVEYFTEHARGFSVESGTPSLPTLEAWQRTMARADQWPIGDAWAYHDWHQTGNGGVRTYMDTLDARFGAGTSLPDFERKAQMMQYESYRAIFEGMNAGLWTVNSGRMLWMTQPAWPSSAWQIFSSDYDTHASFYGVKKASEPVHVQMNLPDGKVVLVNNSLADIAGATVTAKVVDLAGRTLAERTATIDARHEAANPAFALDLPALTANGMVLVSLKATDARGEALSDNLYWQGANDAAYRGLTTLPAVALTATAAGRAIGDETEVRVTLANRTATPAIETKLTVMNADGSQVLPAYFSDNYVSLLPGETRTVSVRYPSAKAKASRIALRGWNVAGQAEPVR